MIVNEEMAASIIPMHVLTGCHHNSGFYGVGKKLIADPLQSFQEAHSLLEACGSQLPVPQKVLRDLEQFVIQYVYSGWKNTTLADAKAAKWRTQNKTTITLAYLQKHYELQNYPSPISHGWHLVDCLCLPIYHTHRPLLPSISMSISEQSEEDRNSEYDSGSDGCNSDSYDSISDRET